MGVGRNRATDELLYFCTWVQNNEAVYYMPSWVQSHILKGLRKEHLVVHYFER